jgi:EpsI family protein
MTGKDQMMRKVYTFEISAIVLIVTLITIFMMAQRGEPAVVKTNLDNLPMTIGKYTGAVDTFPDSVYKELNADYHIYRHYRSAERIQIDLYIGYYGTAKGGRTGHNPYACLPSAGWAIMETGKIEIKQHGKKITINSIVALQDDTYDIVLHWYQSDRNRVFASGIQQNIQRFISRILYNRNDGAFVRVSMLSDKNNIGRAQILVKEFAANTLSMLPNYWPIEQ